MKNAGWPNRLVLLFVVYTHFFFFFSQLFWGQIRHSTNSFIKRGVWHWITFHFIPYFHSSFSRSFSFLPSLSLSLSLTLSPRREGKMAGSETIWFFVVLSISMLLSWTNPRGETLKSFSPSPLYYSNSSTQLASFSNDEISGLKYDFYDETFPQAESIIRTSMAPIYSDHNDVSAALLRLFFHDCFIEVLHTCLPLFLA